MLSARVTRRYLILVASAACLWLPLVAAQMGCDQPAASDGGGAKTPSAAGGVAVVDLDRVGKAMGWTERLQKELEAAEADQRRQLQDRARVLLEALETKKKQVTTAAKLTKEQVEQLNNVRDVRELEKLPLTPEQRQDLVQTLNAVNQELQAAQGSYQQGLRLRQAGLIGGYREIVRPVVRRVAVANGVSVVMIPSDTLLYHEPSADLTDKVIDELQRTPAAQLTPQTTPATRPGG